MAGKLFEYCVLYHPKSRKAKDGDGEEGERVQDPSKLIVDVTRIVAKDDKTVALLAARAIPAEYEQRMDQVEVIVRPF